MTQDVDWKKVRSIATKTHNFMLKKAAKIGKIVNGKSVTNSQIRKMSSKEQKKYFRLRRLLEDHYPPHDKHLCGWCAISSRLLHKRLRKEGIKSHLIVGHYDEDSKHPEPKHFTNHTWVRVGDKNIDITAKQFNKNHPKVLVTDHSDKRYSKSFQGRSAERHFRYSWPKDQKPISPIEHKMKRLETLSNNKHPFIKEHRVEIPSQKEKPAPIGKWDTIPPLGNYVTTRSIRLATANLKKDENFNLNLTPDGKYIIKTAEKEYQLMQGYIIYDLLEKKWIRFIPEETIAKLLSYSRITEIICG